jgi:hypothetical protein
MTHARSATHGIAFALLCLVFVLPAAPAAAGIPDVLPAVGGNSSNSRMFWLNYDPDDPTINEAVQVNTAADASARPSLNSFTFFQNTCTEKRSDVIAAATNSSELLLYKTGKGNGKNICSGGSCPARPGGLSTSNEQRVAVASTGAGGSTAGIWIIDPTGCAADDTATFVIRGGGRFSVAGTRSKTIVDTAFVLSGAEGLEEGDLLVLSSDPASIAIVPKANIEALATTTGNQTYAASPLVASSFFGKATPTGMAWVPGEAAKLLVTLSTGEVRVLKFAASGNGPSLASWHALSGWTFLNPRGIAAGTRDHEPYIIVAEQNQGRFIRAELATNSQGSLYIPALPNSVRTIVSPVGAPQGVAINPEESLLSQCFQPVTEPDGTTGCPVEGTVELHFSQGFDDPEWPPASGRIDAKLHLVPDINRDSDGMLLLPEYDDEDNEISPPVQAFLLPPTCRGFATDSDNPLFGEYAGQPHIALLDIELVGFSITPANFILVTELAQDLLGLDGDCSETGARIYYHPSKGFDGEYLDGGTLFDTTFSCQNPSRSIVENFSPLVLCANVLHLARNEEGDVFLDRLLLNEELRLRIKALKDTVAALDSLGFTQLAGELQQLLVGFTNPDNRNISEADLKAYFLETSAKADAGALGVFDLKKSGAFFDPNLPTDIYAQLLRGFLSLAFYAKETGALEAYAPPWQFCQPYTIGDVQYDFELADVSCAAQP